MLGRTLLENDLLDELKVWVHPLFVGRGESLFQEGAKRRLRLVATKTLGKGVVVLSYQPVKRS
jgi:dihydrofolate reductase